MVFKKRIDKLTFPSELPIGRSETRKQRWELKGKSNRSLTEIEWPENQAVGAAVSLEAMGLPHSSASHEHPADSKECIHQSGSNHSGDKSKRN